MANISKNIFLLLFFCLNFYVFNLSAQQNDNDKPKVDSLNSNQPTNLQKGNTTAPSYLAEKPLAQNEKEGRWIVGAGVVFDSYTLSPGLNFNATYRILGNFHLGPDFSIMLDNTVTEDGKREVRKAFEFNLNVQHVFEINDNWAIYPFTGPNLSKITIHPVGEEAVEKWVAALNLGAGIEYSLKKNKLFCEGKYVTYFDKWDIAAGYLFIIPSK
ncbi:MAG: hypothetical protein ACKVOU_08295 [Cytophagales bacterium]